MVYKRRAIVSCKDDEWDILMNDIEWSLFLHLLLPLLESEVTCERFPCERVVVRTKFIFLFSTSCCHLPLPLRNRHHQKLCNHQSYARLPSTFYYSINSSVRYPTLISKFFVAGSPGLLSSSRRQRLTLPRISIRYGCNPTSTAESSRFYTLSALDLGFHILILIVGKTLISNF